MPYTFINEHIKLFTLFDQIKLFSTHFLCVLAYLHVCMYLYSVCVRYLNNAILNVNIICEAELARVAPIKYLNI